MIDSNHLSVLEYWDQAYENGANKNAPSVLFIKTIITTILDQMEGSSYGGLYVGCGNGQNYIPMSQSGLDMVGLDISKVGLNLLAKAAPEYSHKLVCADFGKFESNNLFDYIISIQVFHFGTESQILHYFAKASQLLRPGGLLFLRVPSTKTEIIRPYKVTERNSYDGFTMQYTKNPFKGFNLHFFSKTELEHILSCNKLFITYGPKIKIESDHNRSRSIAMWEFVAKKNSCTRNKFIESYAPKYVQTSLPQYI